MSFRKSQAARIMAVTAVSTTVAATSLVLATAGPVDAKARCTNGKPDVLAGSFTNKTDQVILVKGDKYLGNGKYKVAEVAVGKNGGKATSLCDVDFIKPHRDFFNNNVVYDGDDWHKIIGSWSCWNDRDGSGFDIACG